MEIQEKMGRAISEISTLASNQVADRLQDCGDYVQLIITGQLYLCSRIERYSHTLWRSRRNVDATHNSLRLVVPATNIIIGTGAFRSASPDIWNKLPDDIVKSPLLLSFRKHTIFG